MMKKILLLLAFFGVVESKAQSLISLNENFVVQLIFESEVLLTRLATPNDFAEPTPHKNIVFLQPLGDFQASNLTVLCSDGTSYSLRLSYTTNLLQESYVITKKMALNQIEVAPTAVTAIMPNDSHILTSSKYAKILRDKGFIATRNMVKYKSFALSIIGVYTSQNRVYLRLELLNEGNIPYTVETMIFTIKPKRSSQTVSGGEQLLVPVDMQMANDIRAKSAIECVYEFDRFTLGGDYILQIDCIESQGGARNLSLTLSDEIILMAKQI